MWETIFDKLQNFGADRIEFTVGYDFDPQVK